MLSVESVENISPVPLTPIAIKSLLSMVDLLAEIDPLPALLSPTVKILLLTTALSARVRVAVPLLPTETPLLATKLPL